MDNSSIKDFTLAISRITQDDEGRYTWEFYTSQIEEPYTISRFSPGKFRTNPSGRGAWRWSEYLCDWVQVMEVCHFSLVCAPSERCRRVVALHTV